jgi:hypothetical protein
VFQALHADAYMRTTPENVQDVLEAVRRIVEEQPPMIERRRDLQSAKLPLDVECALEHAALALDQVRQVVVAVIQKHLPANTPGCSGTCDQGRKPCNC